MHVGSVIAFWPLQKLAEYIIESGTLTFFWTFLCEKCLTWCQAQLRDKDSNAVLWASNGNPSHSCSLINTQITDTLFWRNWIYVRGQLQEHLSLSEDKYCILLASLEKWYNIKNYSNSYNYDTVYTVNNWVILT